MKNFSKSTFFLVSNFHTYGIQHALYNYLKSKKVQKILFLNHPLHGVATDYRTTIEYFPQSKKIETINRITSSEPVNYFLDLLTTLKIGFSQKNPYDVFIGFNSLNTLAGLLLKAFGKVLYVITYSHSYKERRYKNSLLNLCYKLIDSIAVRFSDSVWGLSNILSDIRMQQGVARKRIIYVPDGVDTSLIRPEKFSHDKKFKLVFLGLINKINGLDLVVDAMPELIKKYPTLTLDVIGDGEDLKHIKKKISEMHLENVVFFHGILSIDELAKLLPSFGIGLATYRPVDDSTLKTTDPMKTKLYMASGLPIISTDIYSTAHEIKDERLGVLIEYKNADLINAVSKLLQSDFYETCRKNCIKFAKRYDWQIIFDRGFSKTNFLMV